jgi:hypothetical protein
MIIDNWYACYPSNWKGLIVPEAMKHPAKYSRRLIRRIYDHIKSEGWVNPGEIILDPFGGVALGAMDAMRLGLKWRGIELEPRFFELGNLNILLWNKRFNKLPGWSQNAYLINGDSRNLVNIIQGPGAVISSPPYAENILSGGGGIANEMRSCYPEGKNYSTAAISSPPFGEAYLGGGGINALMHNKGNYKLTTKLPTNSYSLPESGSTPGQLGAMKATGFEAAISSPPFEGNPAAVDNLPGHNLETRKNPRTPGEQLYFIDYYKQASDGNLGNNVGEEFWTAARIIMDQVYSILVPGGHAVWVCKDFIKNKQLVPFCDQWRLLAEAAGFITLHEHHALLVHSIEHDFDGKEKRRDSKSFFRRLAEKNGSPRIDYETVFCMVKG